MKFNKTLISALLGLSLVGVSLNSVADSKVAEPVKFTVNQYNFTGYYDNAVADAQVRANVAALLKEYTGSDVTLAKIDELKSKLQVLFNTKAKGIYTVNVPPQTLKNGVVVINVNFVPGTVTYGETKDYDKENVRRSLPSLEGGLTFVNGRPYVDDRELTMAVENPLKLTQVEYELRPGEPINAFVNVIAPKGKHLRYVQVDNNGGSSYGYLRGTLGYINGNLTNRDDVFGAAIVTNFKNFKEYFVLTANYSLPLYAQHQRLDFFGVHSSTKATNKVDTNLAFNLEGRGDVLAVNWSYYLPHYDWSYTNQLKLVAGYTFKRIYTDATLAGSSEKIKNGFYFVSPFKFGVTGKIVPVRGVDIDLSLTYNFFYAGKLGTSNIDVLRAEGVRSVTAEKFEDWIAGSVSVRKQLEKDWSLFSNLGFSYTNKHLIQIERFSNAVRGFRDGSGSADSGIWLKNEIITPDLYEPLTASLKAYAFLDGGYVRYNRGAEDVENNPQLEFNSTTETAGTGSKGKFNASTGLGLRWSYKNLSLDTYYAYNLTKTNKAAYERRHAVYFSTIYRF